jgi:sn-glycerol 3-phosphate transport system permease protein
MGSLHAAYAAAGAIVTVFFLWPAAEAVQSSFYLEDPFGFGATFVGFDNFVDTADLNSDYGRVARFTAVFHLLRDLPLPRHCAALAVKADKVCAEVPPTRPC